MQFDRDNGRLIAIFDGQRREMPDGPWHDEPDRVDFEHAGFPCLLLRGPGGSWCGYVGTPPGHPWHGRDFAAYCDDAPDINVHGGVTYSAECETPLPGQLSSPSLLPLARTRRDTGIHFASAAFAVLSARDQIPTRFR